jgi:hypothetical protein
MRLTITRLVCVTVSAVAALAVVAAPAQAGDGALIARVDRQRLAGGEQVVKECSTTSGVRFCLKGWVALTGPTRATMRIAVAYGKAVPLRAVASAYVRSFTGKTIAKMSDVRLAAPARIVWQDGGSTLTWTGVLAPKT